MSELDIGASSGEDRAFVADAIEPVPVSPVPASIPCVRCVVLEDLLNTATSDRDKARDESTKADKETLELKIRDIRRVAREMTSAYAVIKAFERRAEQAEGKLAIAMEAAKPVRRKAAQPKATARAGTASPESGDA